MKTPHPLKENEQNIGEGPQNKAGNMCLLEEDAVKRIIWQKKKNEMDMINEMIQKAKVATRGEIKSRCSQKKKPASFIKRYKWKCTVAASRVERFIWRRSYQPINIL